MSTGKLLSSAKKKKYAVVVSEEHPLLSRDNLRSIDRFMDTRVVSASYTGTSASPSSGIPPLPFERVLERGDDVLKMEVQPIHDHESALDIPLRFIAPEEYHMAPIEELPARVSVSRRIAALLQGAECTAVSWRYHPPVAKDYSIVQISATKDAEARAQSALRSGKRHNAALLFCVCGGLHYSYGNVELALFAFQRALDIFEDHQDVKGVAYCHNIMGVCYYRASEFKMSLVHHTKQEALGGSYAKAVAEINMGVSYAAIDELEFAQQAFEDALQNAEAAKDTMLITIALGNLGLVSLRIGDMRAAQSNLEQCLEQCSLAGDKNGASLCLLLLGEVYSLINDHLHALFYYEHAYRVGGEAQNADVVNIARVSIGIARGNTAIGDAILNLAKTLGKTNTVHRVVNQLPQ